MARRHELGHEDAREIFDRIDPEGGAGGTTVTNVAAGALNAGSSDAVNGSQLFATNMQVDANTIAIQANADAIGFLIDAAVGQLPLVGD